MVDKVDKFTLLEERKEELIRRIKIIELRKQKILDFINETLERYKSREIGNAEYQEILRGFLGEKSGEEWIESYDDSLKKHKSLLSECEKEIKKGGHSNLAKNVVQFAIIFIVLPLLLFFVFKGSMVGWVISEQAEITYPKFAGLENLISLVLAVIAIFILLILIIRGSIKK